MRGSPFHRWRWTVTIGYLCFALTGVSLLLWPWPSTAAQVVIEHNGARRTVELGRQASVQEALTLAQVQLVPAHLLSAISHRPIPGHDRPPVVLLNGHLVDPGTVVTGRHNRLIVIDTPDQIEGVVTTFGATQPPEPLPAVLRALWEPGQFGRTPETINGAFSGELVSTGTTIPPSSPAPVTDRLVALTFDDGPWTDTNQFLAVLQQAGVRATFCMIGRQVLAHPDWVHAVVAAGMTVCNHTFNHNLQLGTAPPDLVDAEVRAGADALKRVTGEAPKLYRSPGGGLSPRIEADAQQLGEQVLGWNVDPADYRRPGPPGIVDRVMAQVQPGSIILLHDGGGDRSQTLAALPVIIARLLAAGYQFTTPDG